MASDQKTLVLITGAQTGLGFEVAKALFASTYTYHILVGCRGDISRATNAISHLSQLFPGSVSSAEPLSIDISSDESIYIAFEDIKKRFGYVDILLNNAGADLDTAIVSGTLSKREGWNLSWDVNVTGTHLLTETFAPLLLAAKSPHPRLLFITSGLASLSEHSSGSSHYSSIPAAGWPKPSSNYLAYRSTKSGLNMVATEWARLLYEDGVKVFIISPGFLNTGLGRDRSSGAAKELLSSGAIDPAIGAAFCVDVIEGKRDSDAWPPKVLRKTTVQPW